MGDNIQSKVAVKSMVVSSSVTPAPPENVGGLQELANGAGERRPSQAQLPAAAASPSKGTSSSANNNVVGVHYKIGRKIGEGSFGIIYEGLNLLNNQPIAIKFEPRKSDAPQLRDEYRTYKIMANTVGVPSVYYFGQEGLHNILCIDLLGPSLEDMFDLCNRKFSVKTACMAAKQMITRVQAIHEKNLIYRDIKPDNFLVGRIPRSSETSTVNLKDPNSIVSNHTMANPHPASQVYIVDFGMAKQYRDPKTKVHIPYREKKSLSGTARYMSINTHLGREQSRRDDLEALGHVFMYFLRGSLPWQGLKAATNKQKYEKIGEKKQLTSVLELCENLPEEFGTYLNYVRGLKFEEQPDYDHCRELMNKVLKKIGEVDDGVFDWMIVLDQKRKQKEALRDAEKLEGKASRRGSQANVDDSHTRASQDVRPSASAQVVPAATSGNTSQQQSPNQGVYNSRRPSEIRHDNPSVAKEQKDPSPITSPTQQNSAAARQSTTRGGVQVKQGSTNLQNIEERPEEKRPPSKKKKKFSLFSCCKVPKD